MTLLQNLPLPVVSIPVWDDYKAPSILFFSLLTKFQFQCGTIIRVCSQTSSNQGSVSIPVWCDYKLRSRYLLFVQVFVSIPVWCDYKQVEIEANYGD